MFFYQSDVKEASGMLNIHFGLALIDTLDLIYRRGTASSRKVLNASVMRIATVSRTFCQWRICYGNAFLN